MIYSISSEFYVKEPTSISGWSVVRLEDEDI